MEVFQLGVWGIIVLVLYYPKCLLQKLTDLLREVIWRHVFWAYHTIQYQEISSKLTDTILQ